MKRSRVALVYPFDPQGQKVGGVETFVRGFIKHAPAHFDLAHLGITTSIDCPVGRWRDIEVEGRALKFLPILREGDENKKSKIPLSLRFTNQVRPYKSEVETWPLLFNRIEPALAFTKHKALKIGIIHNDIPAQLSKGSEYYWRHAPWLYSKLERFLFKRFDKVFTVNGKTLDLYSRLYPTMDVSFLPTWVDGEVFTPVAGDQKREVTTGVLSELRLPSEAKYLLFAGRLQQQKNPLLLIRAFARFHRSHSNVHLVVVGEGDLRNEVEAEIAKLDLKAHVHLVGFKDQATLARYYAGAIAFVLSSNFEGMPRACLEALGCGTPVASTEAGEVRRVVTEGVSGEICPIGDEDALSNCIARIYEDPGKYSMRNCVASVDQYRPANVLAPLYQLIDRAHDEAR